MKVWTATVYYYQMAESNLFMMLPMVLVLSVGIMWLLMLPYLYALMVGYENNVKSLLKNAFLLAAARAPQALLARLITFIPIFIILMGIYVGNVWMIMIPTLYYLLFGFAFSKLVYASFANSAFDKYLHPFIEGAKVNQGLRPRTEDDDILEGLDDDEDEEDEEEDDE